MKLSREKIQRMVKSTNTRGGGGGGGAGGVSEGWVEENYLSKAFWNQIFEVRGTQTTTVGSGTPTVVDYVFGPNELPATATTTEGGVTTTVVTAITSIKVKSGLWTEQYLSALGQNSSGGGGGGSETLSGLLDVQLNSPSNGQALVYDGDTSSVTYGKWVNRTIQASGGTVTSVAMTAPTGFQVTGGPITSSGTLTLAFGGSVTANQVLASPNGSAGAPAWRALVAADIPDLSSTYLSATALSRYTWWGRSLNDGAVTGSLTNVTDITMLGNIYFANTKKIQFKDSNSNYLSAITVDSGNNLIFGEQWTAADYNTYIRGHQIFLQTGTSYNNRLSIDDSGRVSVINGTEGLVIGDGRIVWDSTNNALKVIKANGSACNFYSLGGIAALGLTSGTSASLTNLEVTNTLTVGSKLNIGGSNIGGSTCYIESLDNGESINIRAEQKIEMTDADLFMNGSSIHIAGNAAVGGYIGLYFNNTHYLYCSGSDLYFYNGSTHKKIAFV